MKVQWQVSTDQHDVAMPLAKGTSDFAAAVVLFSDYKAKIPFLINGGLVDVSKS